MKQKLDKNAQSVQNVLDEAGLSCQVLEFPSGTRTSKDASASIGCELGQIAKSLMFKTKGTHRPVLVLASGPNLVDEAKIALEVGEDIEKADADFTREITGFAIGGIPPVGHQNPVEHVFIDQDLMGYEDVWSAAGTPHAVFCIKSVDLQRITGARVISLSKSTKH